MIGAGVGVELNQAIAGGHVEDAVVALAVGPVGHAAAGKLAGRDGGAISFPHAVGPDQFAGLGVERDHGAPRAGRGVDDAFDHERRAFELVLRARAKIVGLETPGHFELVEVRRVDLIERRIFGAFEIGGVVRPFAVLGGWLTRGVD